VNALTIPLQSVTTVKGRQVCFAQQGTALVPVPVVVGNFNDQFIEIRSGLKEGDQVALTPPANASDDLDLSGSVLSTGDARPSPATAAQQAPSSGSKL
jgi:multidrug efflux pump subunit AcrA (membrane-fusion protein)